MKKLLPLLVLLIAPAMLAAESPNPAKLALAREVVAAMKADKMFDGIAVQLKQMAQQMAPPMPEATPEQRQIIDRFMAQVMDLSLISAKGLIAKMDETYAAVFSEQELVAMRTFYLSPEGQSALAKQPQVVAAIIPQVQQMQRELHPKLMQLAEEMKGELAKTKAPTPSAEPKAAQ